MGAAAVQKAFPFGKSLGKKRCKACGVEESERVAIHCNKGRCVVACGVLLARKHLSRAPCDGCGDDEKEMTRFERPELPGLVWCWACAEHGAAFWEWSYRMEMTWLVGIVMPKDYPFTQAREMKGRHKLWPFTKEIRR
jgi:hypothetical protein